MQKYVYVGCSARSKTAGPVNALFRRTAESDRWEMCGLPDNTEVYHVTLHPNDTKVVFAATNRGLYRSDDQGSTWTILVETVTGEIMFSILFHPLDPQVIFVGTGPIGLLKSLDGGKTWRRMPAPNVSDRFAGAMLTRIMRMAISPHEPDVLWAGMEVNGLMRSDDGGETWTDLNDHLIALAKDPNLQSTIITKDPSEGMLDVHSISVSTAAPGAVFVACRMGLFRGDEKGAKWTDMGIGRYSEGQVRYGREILPAPWDPKVMFACVGNHARGEHGRLYRSEDTGANWKQLDNGVSVVTPMIGVAVDRDGQQSIHCVGRKQSFSSLDGGKTWRELPMPAEAGSAVTIAFG